MRSQASGRNGDLRATGEHGVGVPGTKWDLRSARERGADEDPGWWATAGLCQGRVRTDSPVAEASAEGAPTAGLVLGCLLGTGQQAPLVGLGGGAAPPSPRDQCWRPFCTPFPVCMNLLTPLVFPHQPQCHPRGAPPSPPRREQEHLVQRTVTSLAPPLVSPRPTREERACLQSPGPPASRDKDGVRSCRLEHLIL